MSICFVLGTRPEIIKLSPLIRRAGEQSVAFSVVHTGQHYDYDMDRVFFEECRLPEPDHQLQAAGKSQAEMLGKMFTGLEPLLDRLRPSVVVVEGDTNSVFAGAFMAHRLGIPVAHVEAGLRSDDWTMPEEVNRVLTDRLSDRLYAPTRLQVARLTEEGISEERILLSGNTIQNAVHENLEKALASPDALPPEVRGAQVILTLHRPTLVDDREQLTRVLGFISKALQAHGLSGVLFAHPRTKRTLDGAAIEPPSIAVLDVLGYLPMLRALSRAKLLITDSGGLQEEAAILKLACITVRDSTERPETVLAGGNVVTGFGEQRIRAAVDHFTEGTVDWKPLYEVDSPADVIFQDLVGRYA